MKNIDFLKYMQICRKAAVLTQEEAAEKLHISTRSLRGYETGTTPVPEDVVISMTEVYKSKTIAYYYLKYQNKVGKRFLPDFKTENLAQAVIRLKKEIADVLERERKLFEIVTDGKITEEEEEDWKSIQKEIQEAGAAAMTLGFLWDGDESDQE